jgi:hypothetical protein
MTQTLNREHLNSSQVNSSKEFESDFRLWSKYEEITMHFNELIIKLRVQALGGVTITGTIATALFKGSNNTDILKFLLPMYFLGWLAIYFLDVHYYDHLLTGAVNEILVLESKLEDIKLSTKIKEEVERNKLNGRRWFYGTVSIALLMANIFLWFDISAIANYLL